VSIPRRAARRDVNDSELKVFAERVGWKLWKLDTPCDYLGLRRGVWWPIEIKDPDKEGHADEFTYDQRKFMAETFACGGRVLVWRTKEDVMRDSNARTTA
jgi:hypothetical protein